MITGTLVIVLAGLGAFGKGAMMLLFLFLGLQQITLAGAELPSDSPSTALWGRWLSLLAGTLVAATAGYLYLVVARP